MNMAYAAAEYRNTQHGSASDLISQHRELVRRIAHHIAARLPSSVEIEDLIQSGMIGLMEAARQYQSDQGATFETYASIRIRGAMIDEVRRSDWAPRSVRRGWRAMVAATRAVEQREGCAANPRLVAEEMGISFDEYNGLLHDASRSQLGSFEDLLESPYGEKHLEHADASTPASELDREAFRDELVSAIETLPERERLVLSLYYEQELNLREIGAVLEVSESRVCQIHGQAMLRLRSKLADWREDALSEF